MNKIKSILVIGDAIIDKYVYGNVDRVSPEDSSVDILDVVATEYRLGGCLNVASNIKSIHESVYINKASDIVNVSVGLSTIFSSFTSKKVHQRGILSDESSFLEAGRIRPEPSHRELIKTRYINRDDGTQMLRVDNNKRFLVDDLHDYHGDLPDFSQYDIIVVSDYCKGIVNIDVIKKIEKAGAMVFVDTKNPDLSVWKGVAGVVIKINQHEFQESKSPDTVDHLIVTLGSEGCLYQRLGKHIHTCASQAVENPEVTGCGDVFLAGLVVGFIESANLRTAMKFANFCARKNTQKKGTSVISF